MEAEVGVGRPSLGLVTVKVGLPEEMLTRLDADGLNRSEWVREACEMRLAGLLPVRDVRADPSPDEAARPERKNPEPKRVVTREPRRRDWGSRAPEVLAVIDEHRYSVPALAKRLGWTELMLEQVLKSMEADGLIRFDRGEVVAA